ncbi:MAG: DUF4194 domain-containing protein [Clostridia bacterium]|jgi:hypothetical protein
MTTFPYAPSLVKLLKGPVYADAGLVWDLILRHRSNIDDYFSHLGLELVLAEHDGLAFLRRRQQEDEPEAMNEKLPELVARRELPYTASLLCILLLEELYRFENSSTGESRLVMDRAHIRELILPYLPKKSNEAKQADALDAQINRLVSYGFLRPLSSGKGSPVTGRGSPGSGQASAGTDKDELEVTKLLKYKISADLLVEALERLKAHTGAAAGAGTGDDDE